MNKFNKFFVFAACIMFSATLFSSKVKAATISPDKYYIDAEPGKSYKFNFKVIGSPTQPGPIKLYVYTMGMKKTGEEDDREFYTPNPDDASEPANWIKMEQSDVTVNATDIISIPWDLNVNAVAQCGTNLAAIVVSSIPESQATDKSQIGIQNYVISQVHINIGQQDKAYCDEVKSNLNLLDFKIDSNMPIFNYDNIPFLTRIQNTGNLIAQKPKGYIEIFGLGPKITIPFNDDNLDIYPNTIRRFSNEWIDPDYPTQGSFIEQTIYELSHFRFGQYEARLGVTFNVKPEIVSTVTFWIIPWRLLLIALIIIAIFLFFVIRDRRRSVELKKLKKIKQRK